MKFTKMQSCGNDYIYINCFPARIPDPAEEVFTGEYAWPEPVEGPERPE